MAAKRVKNATAAKCWGNALSAVAAKRQKYTTLGKCAVGAYLDKNATEAKSWGNALSAVAAKRLKYATHDKCCGNTQWLLNTKNTYRMLSGGEMRSGCQTRYKRNGSLLLRKYAVAV